MFGSISHFIGELLLFKLAFPVNIAPESIQKGYIIKPSELAGEPIVNGDNAFTLRLYSQMQEYKALITKDKNFSLLSRVQ